MNGRKRWPGRALAIMMSAILMVSSMGLTVFADEQIPGSSDAGVYEETAATGTEGSAQEDESFPGDGSVEEEQDIEEQGVSEETGDLSADEADDDHPAEDETADTGRQEDPASSADTESGDKGANEDIAQSGDDEIEEDIAQITENEAGKSAEQPSGETLGAAPDESEITTWAGLQEAFIAGGTVTLTQDVISSEENGDRGLYIPDGVSVTLNLGGHTLNMITSLPDPFDPEYDATEVIKVCGNLILEGEGTITGGSDGIKVDKSGSLTMNSGTVTGYDLGIRADSGSVVINGGTVTGRTLDGIRIFDSASLTMNGGTISGGSGDSMCISYGTFILHGGTITGNICLQRAVITLDRKLDDAARYRVYTYDQTTTHMNEEEAVITSGLSGNGSERNFVSCDEKFIAALDKDGEVVLAPKDSVAKYLERSWSGNQVVSKERARTATPFPNSKSVSGGWYYLNDNVTVKDLVSLEGDTNLILGDGFTLDVEGLYIPQGSTLTIYAQSDGENAGKIISEPDSGAAIGATSDGHPGGTIVIHGGNIEAKGHDNCAGIGSNAGNGTTSPITIYGGTITAKGGSDGAGIGGGRNCDGGEITIYGGEITAKGGGDNGAGIGGGQNGSGGTIKIYGGTITTSDSPNVNGAGIGGGDSADGGNITIEGGTITTYSRDGAGIGGGAKSSDSATSSGGIVVINGGNITATGGKGAGIGGGYRCSGGTVNINGGVINASGSYGIGRGEDGSDVAVTLGYTDATKETISITASTFNGTVTLEEPFAMHSYSRVFPAGVVSDNSLLGGGALTFWNGEVFDWNTLQMAINGAADGVTITLGDSVFGSVTDDALHVGSGKKITIDLKGYSINRGLENADPQTEGRGCVIKNEGTLTITDSSSAQTGTITGGNCKGAGGGIYNSGTLTITGGSITGNAASTLGGGVYLPDASANNNITAFLNLNGGSITNNTCGNSGGGVHVSGTASMTVSGSPVVSGNKKNDTANNINLTGGAVIQVTGALTEDASLGVSNSGGKAFITRGYGANNGTTDPDAFFHADDEAYGVILDTGEVKIDVFQSGISYLKRSWNGTAVTTETATSGKIRAVPEDGGMTEGWYYLNSDVTLNGRICLTGSMDLILGDGKTLDVKGIYIPQGSTLTIYAQSDGEGAGRIISKPDSGAAIGATSDNHPGGEIVIHGGNIEAKGAEHCAGIGSNDGNGTTAPITIYGGTITAKGGSDGAGIGGGRDCDGGEITIYGGEITAKGGGENGAGIGGGDSSDGGTITIYGGTITANKNPNEDGAGIGGGDAGKGGNITINGGTITTWSCDGAGIGGGDDGEGGTITINGGIITCNDGGSDSEAQGARIGGGCDADGGTTTITGGTIDVYFRDGAGIGGGENNDGGTINISGGTVTTHPNGVGNSAGIGGGNHAGDGGTITISGGTIWANSKNGAGIGGGRADDAFGGARNSGSGGTIKISGGEVHAASAKAFGIGAGGQQGNKNYLDKPDEDLIGSAGTVTISKKADVYANGRLAGIGGDSGTINIEGGAVTVGGDADSDNGAGIYLIDKQGRVNISGGKVTATGNGKSSGIYTLYGIVTISGGEVNAAGGPNNGYGIGSYRDGVTYKLVLDYSDKTRDTIRITVDSYHANMMLNKDFICKSSGETFAQGEYMAQWPMAGKTIVASDSRPVLTINGVSDSFNDNIKLNYYFELPDEVLNDEGAYVEITNESAKKDPVTLPVKDVQYTEGKGYRFSIPLAAKEASDTITARAYDSQGNALTIIGNRYGDNYTETGVQSSMMEYFTWLEKNGKDDKEKAVGAAARDYCAAAQLYFGYHVTEGLAVSNAVDAVTADTLSSYIAGREGTLPSGVSIKGISAMLESDNTLRLYYGFKDVDPTTFTFTIDGDRVDLAERSDGMHYLTMKTGVWANKLHGDHTYTVSDGTNTYTITASVLTYARSCANKSDKKQSNLGKALYLYNQAAVAAFGN